MRFSGGGGDWFATLTEQGHEMQFGLEDADGNPVEFTSPVVEGDVAVYQNVQPGMDLVVQAFVTGFEHWWVINDDSPLVGATAAETPVDLSLGLTVSDVSAERDSKVTPVSVVTTKTGGFRIEDEKGNKLLGAPAPSLWDAGTPGPDALDPAGLALATHGKKAPKRTVGPGGEPVGGKTGIADVKVNEQDTAGKSGKGASKKSVVELTVPNTMLTDPELRLPLTVDPSLTVWTGDTWLQYPDYPSSQKTSAELKSGSYDGVQKARSFLVFDSTAWNGKDVTSAKLLMRNYYSGSCTGGDTRVARITSDWDADTLTWSNQPDVSTSGYVDFSTAYGYNSSCPAGWANWDVTSIVRGWVGGTTSRFGLRVRGNPESSVYTWRRYRSGNYTANSDLRPHINITYNQKPSTPAAPTVDPLTSGLSKSLTPLLAAKVADPDGGTVRAKFEVFEGSTSVWSWTQASPGSSSGSSVSTRVPSGKLVDGHSYTVKASAYDGRLWSSASAATSLKVDVTAPTTTVTASGFANGEWKTERPSSNTFTFNGPTDTKSFSVVRDGGAATTLTPNSSGDATLSWLPANGSHSLKVTATDNAGNTYTPAEFKFGLGAAAFVAPNADTRSTGVFPIEASGPPSATGAAVQYRLQGTSTWVNATNLTKGTADWSGTVSQSNGASVTGGLRWDATDEEDPASTSTPKADLAAPAAIELRVCFNYTGTPSQVCSKDPRRVQLVPSAFGGNFPTTEVGPASVALFSGEAAISETDAVDTTAGVGRTFSSYDSATAYSETGPFGPGWATSLVADGDTDAQIIDNRSKDRTIVLVTAGGGSQTYTPESSTADVTSPTNPVRFVPAGSNDGSYLTLDPSADGDASTRATLALSRPAGANQTSSTVWEWKRPDAVDASEATDETPSTPGTEPEEWVLKETTTPDPEGEGEEETATFAGGEYPSWIGQTTPGVAATCTPAEQTIGCRWLKLSYTGTGDTKRLVKIERGSVAAPLTTLATYTYASGMLSQVCGPDPDGSGSLTALCASYDYDTSTVSGRVLLATATPPGQKPWNFTYDSTGRLTKVTRPLDEATGTGNATWTIAYAKDGNTSGLETTAAGLPTMAATETEKWGQDQAPAKVFAVFTPAQVPATSPSAADLKQAELFYTDAEGNLLNTAVHGNTTTDGSGNGEWLVDTVWYDPYGNAIQTLDAAGRQRALAAPAEEQAQTAYEASALTVYNAPELNEDGTPVDNPTLRVEDAYGPAATATLEDGTTGQFRAHTTNIYDDEAPSLGGGSKPAYEDGVTSFDIVVETRTSAASVDMSTDYDITLVRNEYAPIVDGDGNGWTLGTPTKVKTQTGTDGAGMATWSTQINRYDIDGLQIETRQPGGDHTIDGTGSDAHSTVSSYYTKHATDSDCEIDGHPNRAEWEGLSCKTGPAVQPVGQSIPVTYNADYNIDLRPTSIVESSSGATRTKTLTYDKLGRITATEIAISGEGATIETITTTIGYDPATGLPTSTSDGTSTITATADTWGREWTSTDASGLEAITTYTSTGAIASFNDGHHRYEYTYDQTPGEHRGVLTSVDLDLPNGVNDVLTLRRDAAGGITRVGYPNGMAADHTRTETGVPIGLTYIATVAGAQTEVLSFTATAGVDGRVLSYTSRASAQAFSYDGLGRLVQVEDTRETGCITRIYGFSAASERTSLATYAPAHGDVETGEGAGSCQTTVPAAERTSNFDTANRIVDDGYTYDALGRTLTIPASDTSSGTGVGPAQVAYHANDMVKSVVQTQVATSADGETTAIDHKREYDLDPLGRVMSIASVAGSEETGSTRFEYASTADSPVYVTTSEDTGLSSGRTRYVTVDDLGMVAAVGSDNTTVWQIANLHGDVVATVAGSVDAGLGSYSETDEYGNPTSNARGESRYSYLGTMQRSTGPETLAGITLMGARLYLASTGQFLTIDPVPGGNATRYNYPADPVNEFDPSGCLKCSGTTRWIILYSWTQWSGDWVNSSMGPWRTKLQYRFGLPVEVESVKKRLMITHYHQRRCYKGRYQWQDTMYGENHFRVKYVINVSAVVLTVKKRFTWYTRGGYFLIGTRRI
jgi:RHS repeat-associated protein